MFDSRTTYRASQTFAFLILLIAVGMTSAGCSDQDSTNNEGLVDAADVREGTDTSTDATSGDVGDAEAQDGVDDGAAGDVEDTDTRPDGSTQPDGCKSVGELDTTITLDSEGPVAQYFSRAAFDGEGVWVVYTRPEADSDDEDVFAVRILCDGTIDVAPTKVNTTDPAVRDYAPSVDVRAGVVHIVWTTAIDGLLGVGYRSFDADGSALMEESVDATPQSDDDQPISELVWELDVAGLPGGGAAVVGSYGGGDKFRVFAQQIDQTGAPVGAPIDVHTADPQPNQYTPMVAAKSEKELWISWNSALGENLPNSTVFRTLDLTDPQPVEPSQLDPHEGFADQGVPAPFSEPLPQGDGVAFLAYSTAEYRVKLAALGDSTSADVFAGTNSNTPDLRPGLAAGQDSGLVAWYAADPSPAQSQLQYQSFDYDSTDGIVLGTPTTVSASSAEDYARAPYGPSVVYLGNGFYFIAWNEGPATNEAQVVGRFVNP